MKITLTMNDPKRGVELRFSGKPDVAIRDRLKALGFRYSRPQNMWYARQTDDTLAFAQSICSADGHSPPSAETAIGPFFPSFDMVDGVNIYASSREVLLRSERAGYFVDIPALIKRSSSHIMIINLTNALTPGKTCKRLRIFKHDSDDCSVLTSGLTTFYDLYERFFDCRSIPDNCDAYEDDVKSMRTFSPFVQVKPINIPEKWTLPHVWKAILSGQIYDGQIDGRYTDDYHYDAATNYSSGRKMHLPSFAASMIDSPSGWYVSARSRDGDRVQLSVNCHSFDCRTLYFNARQEMIS